MMKKMPAFFLLLFLFAALLSFGVLAGAERVLDNAGLFSESEQTEINGLAENLANLTGADVLVLTVSDAKGKTARQVADDFYYENSRGTGADKSGILYLIDMDNREAYIYTKGEMLAYFNDARVSVTLDDVAPFLAEADYAGSARKFFETVNIYYSIGKTEDNSPPQEEEGPQPIHHILFGGVGLLAGGIAVGSVKRKYNMQGKTYAYPFHNQSQLKLLRQEDRLINRAVTFIRIPKNPPPGSSSGGGGSRTSTFSSRGGGFHGGGGRKF